MSIKGYIDELTMLNTEIKRNNARNKQLRSRVKELEMGIAEYLNSKDQLGLKYNGRAVMVEQSERRPAKKKQEKREDVISLLQEFGVGDTDKAYDRLLEVQKGDPVEYQKVKIKQLKNSQNGY
jgi:hypothetical protein